MCTAHGSDKLAVHARQLVDAERCRVLRGGCYGLCEIGPNVVVRRFEEREAQPDTAADRLTLTERGNETVYSRMTPADLAIVLRAHLEEDHAVDELTRQARESTLPAPSDVAARIRALRDKRRTGG
jgi:(2Fe-2S) ferredoxin